MADVKISALPAATTPLAGTELVPIVQSGVTSRVSVDNLTAGKTVAASTINVDANTASAAVRITQTGSGNALVVEDSANPDATPFVVDANGVVGIGETAPSSFASAGMVLRSGTASTPVIFNWNTTNDVSQSSFGFRKDRAGTIVSSGDPLGLLRWQGFDGAAYRTAAQITSEVDATPGASDMPGRLVFSTTADGASSPTERMRITNAGNVGIGGPPGTTRFRVTNSDTTFNDTIFAINTATGTGAWGRIGFQAGSFYGFIGTDNNGLFQFYNPNNTATMFATNNTERMRIDASGNVGIGTSSPGLPLDVSSATIPQIRAIRPGGIDMRLNAYYGSTDLASLGVITNHPLAFHTNNLERMRITATGNVVAGGSVALATTATDGFLYVPTCAGVPTGTPTAITGMAPIVVNTTNNKLYFYSGGAWRDAGP